jgi:protein TonB
LHAVAIPGAGGGASDGIGAEYAAYLARVRQHIQDSLRYPPAARRRGIAGTVQLEISIAADGAISAVSVTTSSSHEVLDRAAVAAAEAAPRVPFPDDVRPRPLRVRLPVRFELQ